MNKLISKLFLGLLLCLTFTSCVTTRVANLQRTSEKEVEVFMTTAPTKEYVELKFIQTESGIFHNPEQLLKSLTQRAKKEGADALINVRFDFQFYWPYASGVAIKYK